MASLLFSKGVFQQLILYRHLGIHLLQPPVLFRHGLHLGHQRSVHAAILRPPVVERRIADRMLAADVCHRHSTFSLLQDREDLRVSESRFLHVFLQAQSTPEKSNFQGP